MAQQRHRDDTHTVGLGGGNCPCNCLGIVAGETDTKEVEYSQADGR
jgi:hypothetical protein